MASFHGRVPTCIRASPDLGTCCMLTRVRDKFNISSTHRCIDADLRVCRLIGKAGIALELLEVPVVEFLNMFDAAVSPCSSFRCCPKILPRGGHSMRRRDSQDVIPTLAAAPPYMRTSVNIRTPPFIPATQIYPIAALKLDKL